MQTLVNRAKKRLSSKLTNMRLRAKIASQPVDLTSYFGQARIKPGRSTALDLGSGPAPRNVFEATEVRGVDIRAYDINPDVQECVLGLQKLPFQDNSFNYVTAFDVLEHIPRAAVVDNKVIFPFVFLMNEVWRVLKSDGYFYSQTPCFPMSAAFQDPTHVNIMTEDTMRLYFCGDTWAKIYGFVGAFSLREERWCGQHYCCLMQKSSNIAIDGINETQSVSE